MTVEASPSQFDSKALLKQMTGRPGIYRMIGKGEEILYVGKARNLKNRLSSYFVGRVHNAKTQAMLAQVMDVEVTVTRTESEALLLESNLIKECKPRYNILLRDDKGYPYIYVSTHQKYPRMVFHRGARKGKGQYFGPYPSSGAVRHTLHLLQKLFLIRPCEDSSFRNRTRPCLQYQIHRCTAPCVEKISEQDYERDLRHALMFLQGRSQLIIDELAEKMEAASKTLRFELAAELRDQIVRLRRVFEQQIINGEGGDLDVLACTLEAGLSCIQAFFIRNGQMIGSKTFFPRSPTLSNVQESISESEVLSAFIAQYYPQREIPHEILVSHVPDEQDWLEQALGEHSGRKLRIRHRLRGERAAQVELALTNARNALETRLTGEAETGRRYEALRVALNMENLPARMECFDISHTMGEATVASCVVFDLNGADKSSYRRFNIKDITPGDDYAAMAQAIERRFKRLIVEEAVLPDILLIDGGKGQLAQAETQLAELGVSGVVLLGVAKGVERKPGLEQLFLSSDGPPIRLPADSPALHLIQQIRDEAHRFAITGHRQRRAKARKQSSLELISGLGPKRRQSLLKAFGGLQEVERASVTDLAKIKGISRVLAQKVYDNLHP